MDDLVQWFGAQLDEDARIAEAAAEEYGAAWVVDERMDTVRSDTGADVVEEPYVPREFIAEHDPARVLREIDAKRQVLAEYEQASRYATTTWGQSNADQSRARTLDKMVRLLASVYRDRPSYRQEWSP